MSQDKCKLEKFSDRIIRVELNIEQWALWQMAKSARNKSYKPTPKILTREIELEDGTTRLTRVQVGISEYGALTTVDQKTFYALTMIWEDAGQPPGDTPFSIRQLLNTLKMTRGSENIETIQKSLFRLRLNGIRIDMGFYDAVKQDRFSRAKPITLLDDLDLMSKQSPNIPIIEKSSFRFYPLILKNLQSNYRKPLHFDVVLSLKTDLALLIYSYIDRMLSHRGEFKITSNRLFKELGIPGDTYQYVSARTRSLSRAIEDLQGIPLSAAGHIHAEIVSTKDKKDVNVIFRKIKLVSTPALAPPLLEELTRSGVSAKDAETLITEFSEDAIRIQISALPYRKGVIYPGRYLGKAIRENYELPADYLKTKADQSLTQVFVDLDSDLNQQARVILDSLSIEEVEKIKDELRMLGETRQEIIDQYPNIKIIEDLKSGKT